MLILILSFVLLIGLKMALYWIIENGYVPIAINYQPYNCSFCCSFWVNLFLSLGLTYFIDLTFLVYVVLTILDAIAYKIYQKQMTISIDEVLKSKN
jgi:hypothetical protein